MRQAYDPTTHEARWQAAWDEQQCFRALNPGDPGFDPGREKYYVLDMFPYPSGAGLHAGHGVNYVGTDIVARRAWMEGKNVLHPMGWDAFGLPAEQYAIQTGKQPAETTAENTDNFRRQLKRIGVCYDWAREINTSHPRYYRWTQWLFKRLFQRGLAYQTEVAVWWCEELKTVLANEEVINGRSERGNHPCERRPLRQWVLRITAYADRLLADLEGLDWPESIKAQQREWIGRSEGADVTFHTEQAQGADPITIFTTCPDTLWGATFLVLSPEHELVPRLTSAQQRGAVEAYIAQAASKSELERTDLAKEKTGVFTGSYATNPAFEAGDPRARVPIWIADYVLSTYGTGAIMAVPGHDERDWEFAKTFDLDIVEVIRPPDGTPGVADDVCYPGGKGGGTAVNSGPLDGLETAAAKAKAIEFVEQRGIGKARVNYKLRDWVFSRQRYWGEPFPLLHRADGETVAVRDEDLPVELPPMEDFTPSADGSPPLARAGDWVQTQDPSDGTPATRDTDTMPGWAGSCWYWLRYMDPENDEAAFSKEVEEYWGPVDLYVGGASHAVMHLLYARFWHKVFYDEGLVSTAEPFQRLFNQGMIQAFAYQDDTGRLVSPHDVDDEGGRFVRRADGAEVQQVVTKMAKQLGNVVNPVDVIDDWGADAFRLYEMFMGPLADSKPWNPRDIPGCRRFLERTWRVFVDEDSQAALRPELAEERGIEGEQTQALEREWNQALARINDSFARFNFNTAVAAFMTFVNEATKRPGALVRSQAERFVRALSPFAPHLAEELWSRLGHTTLVARDSWPAVDEGWLAADDFELIVQVLGKVRGKVRAPKDASKQELERLAIEAVADKLEGKDLIKTIVVPGRLVNLVVR